jgi:hypothetical protein
MNALVFVVIMALLMLAVMFAIDHGYGPHCDAPNCDSVEYGLEGGIASHLSF